MQLLLVVAVTTVVIVDIVLVVCGIARYLEWVDRRG